MQAVNDEKGGFPINLIKILIFFLGRGNVQNFLWTPFEQFEVLCGSHQTLQNDIHCTLQDNPCYVMSNLNQETVEISVSLSVFFYTYIFTIHEMC